MSARSDTIQLGQFRAKLATKFMIMRMSPKTTDKEALQSIGQYYDEALEALTNIHEDMKTGLVSARQL